MKRLRPHWKAAAATLLVVAACGCPPPTGGGGGVPGGDPRPFAVAMARSGGRSGTRLAVAPGSVVILDGAESGVDRGRAELRYAWKQTSGPQVRIARPDLVRTECRLAAAGTYRFELVVTARRFRSRPSPVIVTVRAAAADGDDPPKNGGRPPAAGREASFALLESNAEELVRVFGAKTGLTLRVEPGWMRPEELKLRPLTFMARRVSPDLALEMAARLLGADYVRDHRDAAFLTRGMGWLKRQRQGARFYPTVRLGEEKLAALARESCRGALFARPGSSVVYDRRRRGIQVIGPVSMQGRVEALLAAVAPEGRRLAARPPLIADERRRNSTLARRLKLLLTNKELSEVGLELGRVLKAPVAWEEPPGDKRVAVPRVSLRGGGRPAREVLAELAKKAGFKGFSWVKGGGIWLYRSEPRPACAEHLWSAARLRAYPMEKLRARGILPGAVLHSIRKKVWPATWRDPATLCAYYKASDKLIVIHSPEVQREVLRLLHDLLEEKPARLREKKKG